MNTSEAAARIDTDPESITLVRFAHAFDGGGGVETYLADLDRALLAELPWTIIRMHLTEAGPSEPGEPVRAGRGRLMRVPLAVVRRPSRFGPHGAGRSKSYLRVRAADLLLRLPLRALRRRLSARARELEAVGSAAALQRILARHRVDLLVMHYVGGRDSNEVIEVARRHGIPYVVVNHFSNDRLRHFAIREQSRTAAGIGGVSADDVPAGACARFTFLADGVDVAFFRTGPGSALGGEPPLIFMPARLTPAKGQHDLVRACADLRRENIRCRVVLAGRADDAAYVAELRRAAAAAGIASQVSFPGQLGPAELRDAYAGAAVVAFPTYHHEGLPRVLLEAQAMQVPPVAYRSGGITERVVPAGCGCLVAPGDLEGLTARLRELLPAAERRRRMGAAGRAHVERHFSLGALAARHAAFYRRAILRPAPRTGSA